MGVGMVGVWEWRGCRNDVDGWIYGIRAIYILVNWGQSMPIQQTGTFVPVDVLRGAGLQFNLPIPVDPHSRVAR